MCVRCLCVVVEVEGGSVGIYTENVNEKLRKGGYDKKKERKVSGRG